MARGVSEVGTQEERVRQRAVARARRWRVFTVFIIAVGEGEMTRAGRSFIEMRGPEGAGPSMGTMY